MAEQLSDVASLMARLERLERRHQRLRFACFGLAVLVGTSVLVAAQAPRHKTLETERLVLGDRNCNLRADLNANGAYLKLFDDKGKVRAELFGDHLKLFDSGQTARAELFGSHLKMFDEKGVTRAQLFGDHLKLFDEKQTTRVQLFADHVKLFDSGEQTQVELNGSPSLKMFRQKKVV